MFSDYAIQKYEASAILLDATLNYPLKRVNWSNMRALGCRSIISLPRCFHQPQCANLIARRYVTIYKSQILKLSCLQRQSNRRRDRGIEVRTHASELKSRCLLCRHLDARQRPLSSVDHLANETTPPLVPA